MSILGALHTNETVKNKLRDVATTRLASEIAADCHIERNGAVALLRIASITATTDLLSEESLDEWFRGSVKNKEVVF